MENTRDECMFAKFTDGSPMVHRWRDSFLPWMRIKLHGRCFIGSQRRGSTIYICCNQIISDKLNLQPVDVVE